MSAVWLALAWKLGRALRLQGTENFTTNLTIVNDRAERPGRSAESISQRFIKRMESEEQRQGLFEVVEEFRVRVKNTTKASLELC